MESNKPFDYTMEDFNVLSDIIRDNPVYKEFLNDFYNLMLAGLQWQGDFKDLVKNFYEDNDESELLNKCLEYLFMPYEDLPMYVYATEGESEFLAPELGAIVRWRLRIGK